jgi:hypothetical protein
MFGQVGQAAGPEPLNFFRNWFLTGDVRMAGVGMRGVGDVNGMAHATINMNNVPPDAEVLSAYLYWSTSEIAPSPIGAHGQFRGVDITGTPLGTSSSANPNPACWSSGGTSGAANSAGRAYRADVRALLPLDKDPASPTFGFRIANGSHPVVLPDSGGTGNGQVIYANGATLVVLYRRFVPGNPSAEPLRAIVAFDGPYSISKTASMTQPIGGFYQASGDPATFSAIVGNGQGGLQPFHSVTTAKNTVLVDSLNNGNLFTGTDGSRWDSRTVALPLALNDASYPVTITSADNQTCLTVVSLWTSTPVVDTDNDGLVNFWETNGMHLNPGDSATPATFGGCADYPADTAHCVDLRPTAMGGMGADPNKKDIFVEIDWLKKVGANAHEHKPKPDALAKIITAFNTVPASSTKPEIHVHFDVGTDPAYQGLPFIVPAALARGGDVIDEDAITCNPATQVVPGNPCAYTEAALSFKAGFLMVKNGWGSPNSTPYSDYIRNSIFHYALFAHSLGGPYDPNTGQPLTGVPWSVSGVAEKPGGDLMITLGKWHFDNPADDQTGTALVQAGTLMHELGHNLGLGHAGLAHTPNCMPIYHSVMNYLYQARGLTLYSDQTQYVDYSFGSLSPLTENSLTTENASLGPNPGTPPVKYQTRYYGPVTDGAATKHCGGSTIQPGEPFPMARLEGSNVNAPDWNNDGDLLDSNLQLDTDYNGTTGDGVPGYGAFFVDSNDWASLNLQQVGAKRSFGGMSLLADAFFDNSDTYFDNADVFFDNADTFFDNADVFFDNADTFFDNADVADEITRETAASSVEKPRLTANPNATSTAIHLSVTNKDGIALIRSLDFYRSDQNNPTKFVLVKTNSGTPGVPPAGSPPATTWDDVVTATGQTGKSCPANKTCYDTTYMYYVIAKDEAGNPSPKSNIATSLVHNPKH